MLSEFSSYVLTEEQGNLLLFFPLSDRVFLILLYEIH